MFESIGTPELIVIGAMATMAFVVIWPASTICRRLGFSPWLGVLAIFPLANLLLLWFVALSRWPRMETTSPRTH
jgi:hypothetical protein